MPADVESQNSSKRLLGKLAVAVRLLARELHRLKLKRLDLPRADLRLGQKAYTTGATEGEPEFVSKLDRVSERLKQLRQQERAQIIERHVQEYRQTREVDEDYPILSQAIDQELNAHPTAKNANPKKLARFLIGRWQSPRHIYVFNADGTTGLEDDTTARKQKWRIRGNQIFEDNVPAATIILLNSDYLVLSFDGMVAFHSRVKE